MGDVDYDAIVIGAGFAGLHMLSELRKNGFTCRAFETGGGVGGTWYWNRYPGARCDIESLDYCYLHDRELHRDWRWTERFATGPEIRRYAEHFAERAGVLGSITFGTRVTAAAFDPTSSTWLVRTEHGTEVRCRFLITAVGCVSAAQIPDITGAARFRGERFHTGRWPHEPVDLAGKRVGVIGTGSSGIQVIPEIAARAAAVVVFQRTANFSVPARNRPLTEAELAAEPGRYEERVALASTTRFGHVVSGTGQSILDTEPAEREAALERRWAAGGTGIVATFTDTGRDLEANALLADFVRGKIRDTVTDPGTAERLVPRDHPIGTKRLCVDSGYFDTFNADHVRLVDLRTEPIDEITEDGVRTEHASYPLDVLVYATGYDAFTGALTRIEITGRDGVPLAKRWESGPETYLGLAVAGFPNLFTITGPGSTTVLSNVLRAIEHHVSWITDLLRHLRSTGEVAEAEQEAQEDWTRQVAEAASRTLYHHADSYYLGANIDGKARVFMPYAGGLDVYRGICDAVARDGYRGFALSKTTLSRTALSKTALSRTALSKTALSRVDEA
ncbi:flavin-containing monooxygenase [Amycolatopsis sp. CA-230715]|uniref:flavin-containing monooxygenase n=1 Tax=Amycolatopsis sp. CA-230715 TaxID=2745196 RepID=UPI001C03877C|nr:NAD(P)/FAD-dependent oxidoreductase [Amycolatopsis sp. CA-230715]QWF78894.1 Phenylacetone monooxygenase [Amycolatopsis sp. CA-230715]